MFTVWILLGLLGLFLGVLFALYLSVHQSMRELAMLYGLGGWAGRLAVVHLIAWSIAVFSLGPSEDSRLIYGAIALALLGTVAGPFYFNNRALLSAVVKGPNELWDAGGSLVPVSGTVAIEAGPTEHGAEINPLTAPFSANACVAYEWAVKRRQRLSRKRTYTTIDSGQAVGTFLLDTEEGLVRIEPENPHLFLVFGVGLTGYETTTSEPSGQTAQSADSVTSTVFDDMRYCETTVRDGDPVTVVGTPSPDDEHALEISEPENGRMYIINADFDRVHRIVSQYLRWTPHVSGLCLLGSWAYAAMLFVT